MHATIQDSQMPQQEAAAGDRIEQPQNTNVDYTPPKQQEVVAGAQRDRDEKEQPKNTNMDHTTTRPEAAAGAPPMTAGGFSAWQYQQFLQYQANMNNATPANQQQQMADMNGQTPKHATQESVTRTTPITAAGGISAWQYQQFLQYQANMNNATPGDRQQQIANMNGQTPKQATQEAVTRTAPMTTAGGFTAWQYQANMNNANPRDAQQPNADMNGQTPADLPQTYGQYILYGFINTFKWIFGTIISIIWRIIVDLSAFSLCSVLVAVLFYFYFPEHKLTTDIHSIVSNVSASLLPIGLTPDEQMLSLVESFQVQLTAQAEAGSPDPNVNMSKVQFSYLQKFDDTVIGEFHSLEDVKKHIKASKVPPQVADTILEGITEGSWKHCDNNLEYSTTESKDSNGGAGFRYCLTVQTIIKDEYTRVYQVIFTIAGRYFQVPADITYEKEKIEEVVELKEQGMLGTYTKDKVITKDRVKKIVKPKYLTKEEFEAIVDKDYVDHAYQVANEQIASEINHRKNRIARS